ncbi:hypothetical protein PR048_004529 [Dryococelus australis]|uniref:Uncharacterized protein n=1 Tax=Dryococelus australis TaxID=614101 RepID=A0ABQ9I5N1_9NEOP|nr:hypothetical protein PR048_004529 [Dryococelus australis]
MLASKFGEVEKRDENGPIAKLWNQYFKIVNLMEELINAEWPGDWSPHIDCVKRMIPYFHGSGHFPHAKSSQLYVQDMMDLSSKMTAGEYHKFTKCDYFTMGGLDCYWLGVWSDMTIENQANAILQNQYWRNMWMRNLR